MSTVFKNSWPALARAAQVFAVIGAASAFSYATAQAQELTTLRVGVTAGPHAEIIEVVKKVAAQRGLELKVSEFTDYVFPNQALANKDLEANSFQHEPYLKNQIAKSGWKISKVAYTVASPMGVYSNKFKTVADIPTGASVAIPNDPSNGARALQILDYNKIIKLRDPRNVTASPVDIVDNPKKLKFVELDAAQIARSLQDVGLAAVNNNYAVQAGLDPVNGSLIKEPVETPWVNIIAVRDEDKNQPWVKRLVEAYQSDEVKQFINTRFKGAFVAAW